MDIEVKLQHLEDPTFFAEHRLEPVSDHHWYETEAEARKRLEMKLSYSLNGRWKFCYASNLQSAPQGYEQPGYSCAGWDEILVPAQMELSGYGAPQYTDTDYPWDGKEQVEGHRIPKEQNPTGCYVRYFALPEEFGGKRLRLQFEGVETAFHCWLNGKYIGYSEDSYTPAAFDITDAVQPGENKLAVEVYRFSSGSWLEDQDFWRMGGIIREVRILALPGVHINDLEVRTELTDAFAQGGVQVDLSLIGACEENVYLQWELLDPDGERTASGKTEINEREQVTIAATQEYPKLWSAEIPNLYQLLLSLTREDGSCIEAVSQWIGFRKVEIKDAIFYLNGKRLRIYGVNRHEFSARKGRAIGDEEMEWDIRFLKQNHFNAVRTSHYPNQSKWYELCDRYGIYVMDETNLETHGTWQKQNFAFTLPGNAPEWKDACMSRAKAMLERDKNHPCIFSWSVGNESWSGETLYEMSEYFRQRDPSRPVHYENVCHDRKWSATTDFESRMYARPQECEAYLQQNPQKPYLLCEYSHAMGNSCGGLKKYTDLFEKYPQYCGGFIWDYIDQSLYHKDPNGKEYLAYGGDFGDRPTNSNFCTDGLLYADRTPSPKMQEVRYLYQPYRLLPQDDGVLVESRQLFSGGEALQLCWKIEQEGRLVRSGSQPFALEPGETKLFPCDLRVPEETGEYIRTATLVLAEDTMYATRGTEQCVGQSLAGRLRKRVAEEKKPPQIIDGDNTYGVRGENAVLQFQKRTGGLSSYKIGGQELVYDITNSLMPNFWRAPVDNDEGNRMKERCRVWKMATLYPILKETKCTSVTGAIGERAMVQNNYQLVGAATCQMTYQIGGDGTMEVEEAYHGAEELPELPCFGMSWKLPKKICRVRWYGRGPEETYIDRQEGGRYGVYETTPEQEMPGYVVPQECGNHTDVRWVELTDAMGRGVRIEAETPFEFSALPYTCHELEAARHLYELPEAYATVLRIHQSQMGVGGDNSWGACPQEEYRIDSKTDRTFRVKVIPL